ncbi:MAG: 3-phosphoshikimate 1-carboxyvinyltransferase [Firmicutes bacterium]|nr:3-phosphoshikimate 1-carboxyvinyltransferase [Bacillota bacterium]
MSEKTDIELFPMKFNGKISAPPSKSLSHRALICAALSNGQSIISNLTYSDDVLATMSALQILGAKFDRQDDSLIVRGLRKIKSSNVKVDCNESGSTLRFLIPLFSLSNKKVVFTGKKSLISRPQTIYKKIFDEDQNLFEVTEEEITINGSIKAREYYLRGDVSSQFISGLMFALPLLNSDSKIIIDGVLESKSYIDLTISMLDEFGIKIKEFTDGFYIEGNQTYHAHNYQVEGDFSQAAFFLVGGSLNGASNISNLDHDSKQGDKAIINIIKESKGKVIYTENGFITESTQTYGSEIDLSDCPDLGPIVSLLASVSTGTTIIKNIHRLRLKESDRVKTTVETLSKLGADITSNENEIIIVGKPALTGGVTVDSFNDHRIAMMVSIASSVCVDSIILTNANAVTKSYPNFFDDFQRMGGVYKLIGE